MFEDKERILVWTVQLSAGENAIGSMRFPNEVHVGRDGRAADFKGSEEFKLVLFERRADGVMHRSLPRWYQCAQHFVSSYEAGVRLGQQKYPELQQVDEIKQGGYALSIPDFLSDVEEGHARIDKEEYAILCVKQPVWIERIAQSNDSAVADWDEYDVNGSMMRVHFILLRRRDQKQTPKFQNGSAALVTTHKFHRIIGSALDSGTVGLDDNIGQLGLAYVELRGKEMDKDEFADQDVMAWLQENLPDCLS